MSIQTPERIVHVGQSDQLSGFAIPESAFAALSDAIFTTIGDQQQYPFAAMLFSHRDMTINGLDAYMLIEELEHIMRDAKLDSQQQDQFTLVYNNVKYQVYNCNVATVTIS